MSDNQIPDLSHLKTRTAATRFAKKAQSEIHWKNRGYIYNGIEYKPDGSKPHSQWRDNPERNKRYWRDVDGKPGRQLESQYRRETNKNIAQSKFTDLTPEEKVKLAKQTQAFNEAGLDSEHTFSKETFSKGKIDHPEHRIGLEPEINRSFDHRMEAIKRSNYFLEKELTNPSTSMSAEELKALIADANPKGPAGRAYRDTVSRHIGQAQFDPEGMMRDFDQEFVSSFKKVPHLRDQINNKLNSIFTTDPSSELYSMGLWHDGKTLDDSWVKITRELNTDSGTFANGKWTPTPDPTARNNIDILSDIGQGKGQFSDIVDLKNKFHNLKRTLPPGEYFLHANNPTKAKYYIKAFKNDPWITLSGEKGAAKNKAGKVIRYDTLKLTVPDEVTQFDQVVSGTYPDWQNQGVPQSDLSKDVSEIARRNEAQMLADRPALQAAAEASGGLKKALMKAGTVLPFVGAGLDAWDVTQRYEEMMNNPNKGFTDWLDKAQFSIASATLGTSFWAEPANFALGLTNLGIDGLRTVFEKEKRDDFNLMMRGVGRGIGHVGRKLLF